MIVALALVLSHSDAPSLSLYRGAPVASPRYWDVTDTYIDAQSPDSNFGGSYTMLGGEGRTILIRFGDLNRVIGSHRQVKSATLVLRSSGGDAPKLQAIYRLQSPWGEGPMLSLQKAMQADDSKPATIVPGAATYKSPRAGSGLWQKSGALGVADSLKLADSLGTVKDSDLRIAGLGPAVEWDRSHPSQNYGFAIRISSNTEFYSSQSLGFEPRLELELADRPAEKGPDLAVVAIRPVTGAYEVEIKNVGTATAIPNTSGTPEGDVVRLAAPLEAGQSVKIAVPKLSEKTAAPNQAVSFRIIPEGPDANPDNDGLTVYPDGKPLTVTVDPNVAAKLGSHLDEWVQAQALLFNDTYLRQSRYASALEGARTRIRVDSIKVATPSDTSNTFVEDATDLTLMKSFAKSLGVREIVSPATVEGGPFPGRALVDRNPGLFGYGDTQFDGMLPNQIHPPYEPTTSPVYAGMVFQPTDLLSATEVATINDSMSAPNPTVIPGFRPTVPVVVLRAQDLMGRPLPSTELNIFQSTDGKFDFTKPIATVKTGDQGTAILSSRGPDGPFGTLDANLSNGTLAIVGENYGTKDITFFKAWQLADLFHRTSAKAAVWDIRLNISTSASDRSGDFARDRIVVDSAKTPSAVLNHLVDGRNVPITLPGGESWFEIDLGRDRSIAEVVLDATDKPFWPKFDIVAYGTGQRPEEGVVWGREMDWAWTLQHRFETVGTRRQVSYRAGTQRIRYIRFVNRSGLVGDLCGIHVIPARLTP